MSSLQRRVGMLILIALLVTPTLLFAQDNAITLVGSGIPAPLIQAFGKTANVTVNATIGGTDNGFATFCTGKADITTATRSITADEENSCTQNKVDFLEFVIGYDIMAVISNPATDVGQCLTTEQLNALFAPSTTVTNWNQVNTANANIPLSFDVPADNTPPYALLDSVVGGVGLREDATTLDSDAAVIEAVSSTKGAFGVVSLPEAQAAGDKVTIQQLNTTSVGCTAPSADAAEGRTYTGAYRLFAYVNNAQIAKVKPLLDAAFGADSATTIAAQGLNAPTDAVYTSDKDVLANLKTGRQFSKDVTAFSIPANLVGTVNIDGAATGSEYMTAVTGAFVKAYAGVTMNLKVTGAPTGIQALCNGTIDIVSAFSDLTPDQKNNCAANNIPTESYYLGSQAVVLLGNGDFLTCLTSAEVAKVWDATSEKTVTKWNQVNDKFPDTAITLVAPSVGDPYADLLMFTASGQNLPTREDFAETNAAALYRITAVGNVSGGMTYMSWQDYQKLPADQQAKAKVVSVDGGKGCVAPSDATISDGTYVLSRPLKLIVNRISMARQEIQSLLWYIASDDNYPLIASNGFTGLSFSSLPDLRDALQKAFVQGQADAAEAAIRSANATPEPTGQATAEATAQATEAAAPATTAPTATTQATTQATAEATSSATPEATSGS